MAKRQRSLKEHFLSTPRNIDVDDLTSTTCTLEDLPLPSPTQNAQDIWKDQWYSQFDWLHFSPDSGRVCCKICKEKGGRSVYAKEGSKNLKVSAFHDHACSSEHKKLCWALQSGGKVLEKAIKQGQRACDESLSSLFRAAYFIGKQSLPYAKFPSLCSLLASVKAPITASLYHDEKSCADLIACMSNVIKKKIICRVRNSPFYGIMIDESTDISVTGHLVVFATIIEEGVPLTVFLGLLEIEDGKRC